MPMKTCWPGSVLLILNMQCSVHVLAALPWKARAFKIDFNEASTTAGRPRRDPGRRWCRLRKALFERADCDIECVCVVGFHTHSRSNRREAIVTISRASADCTLPVLHVLSSVIRPGLKAAVPRENAPILEVVCGRESVRISSIGV